MSNQKNGFTDEELQMMEEMESLIAEMKQHPEIANAKVPESLRKELFRDIREYEAEKAKSIPKQPEPEVSRLTEEEKEWIRLGKKYKKSKKKKKFYVLIAAAVFAMGLGITSMGGPERVIERFGFGTSDRDQVQINSEGSVDKIEKVSEEEIYQQIEDEYGFWPVQMDYLPDGIEFIKSIQMDEIQTIRLYYGEEDKMNISYLIRPNYREGSWGINIEDLLIETYIEQIQGNEIFIKKFRVAETKKYRWTAEYSYENVQYYLVVTDVSEEEFEKIIYNLNFF